MLHSVPVVTVIPVIGSISLSRLQIHRCCHQWDIAGASAHSLSVLPVFRTLVLAVKEDDGDLDSGVLFYSLFECHSLLE